MTALPALQFSLRRLLVGPSIALACIILWGCGSANTPEPEPALESPARILNTTRRLTTQLVTITTSLGTVVTTPDHPFARRGSGWTPAIELAAGDQLETSSTQRIEMVTVLSIEVRDAPPTPVYNLTVAKTHSYFVSFQDLLVHNADCGPNRPRRTLRELLDQEKWAERRDPMLNDTHGTRNCNLCSIAGLSDADKLSAFLIEHKHNDGLWDSHENGMYEGESLQHLKELGLVGPTTPRGSFFPSPKERATIEKAAEESKDPNFPLWPDVTKFMQNSPSNTFLVEVKFFKTDSEGHTHAEGHAMLAVRDVDGSIKFVDLQKRPPSIVDPREARIYKVEVIPTDVDWRYNHQIYRVVSGSR